LRRSLIAAVAATSVLSAGVTVAVAQAPTSTVTVKLSPNKAGTAKKPKATKLVLTVKNTASTQTASKLKITAPKEVVLSTKDFKFCKASVLANDGPTACPSGSQVGPKGQAHAIAGLNGGSPTPVTFEVTPFATSAKTIGFYLQLGGGNITGLAVGTISGHTLTVKIPENPAQQYPAGSYNGLVDLTANLWIKGGKSVVKIAGCPSSKKLTFKNTITFVNNPNPPAIPSHTATATVACKK
jgi:hypothetical protein